jgi:hypothetical protein
MLCNQFYADAREAFMESETKPNAYVMAEEESAARLPGLYIMTYHEIAKMPLLDDDNVFIVFDECHVLFDEFYVHPLARIFTSIASKVAPRLLITGIMSITMQGKLNSLFHFIEKVEISNEKPKPVIRYVQIEEWHSYLKQDISYAWNSLGNRSGIIVFFGTKFEVEDYYMSMALDHEPSSTYVPTPTIVFPRTRDEQAELAVYERMINAVRTLAPHGIHYLHSKVGRLYTNYVFNEIRNKRVNVLIATSILSVGMNFPSIDHVYIHTVSNQRYITTEDMLIQMSGRARRNGKFGVVFMNRQVETTQRRVKTVHFRMRRTFVFNNWKWNNEYWRFEMPVYEHAERRKKLNRFVELTKFFLSLPNVKTEGNIVFLVEPEILLSDDLECKDILGILDLIERMALSDILPIAQILFHCMNTRHCYDAFTIKYACLLIDEKGGVRDRVIEIMNTLRPVLARLFKETDIRIIFANFMIVMYEMVDHNREVWLRHFPSVTRFNRILYAVTMQHFRRFGRCQDTVRVVNMMKVLDDMQEHYNTLEHVLNHIDSSNDEELQV